MNEVNLDGEFNNLLPPQPHRAPPPPPAPVPPPVPPPPPAPVPPPSPPPPPVPLLFPPGVGGTLILPQLPPGTPTTMASTAAGDDDDVSMDPVLPNHSPPQLDREELRLNRRRRLMQIRFHRCRL